MGVFSNIMNYLDDPAFQEGLFEGVSKEVSRQEERREKDRTDLRAYALEKTNRLENEYIKDLDANEEQVKHLAAQLVPIGSGLNANSQEVLSAAQYLIQSNTLVGAQNIAKDLYAENKRFGTNQLTSIGNATVQGDGSLSFRGLAGNITRKPAPVNLSAAGVNPRGTFIDALIDRDSVEEEVQKSVDAITTLMPDSNPAVVINDIGFNPNLLIRPDSSVGEELLRFKQKLMPEAQAENNTNDMSIIKSKIEILESAKRNIRKNTAKIFSHSELNSMVRSVASTIGTKYDLKINTEILGGMGAPNYEEQNEATTEADQLAKKVARDLSRIRKSGNENYLEELGKIELLIEKNIAYRVVEGEYGILTVETDADNRMLKGSYFDPPDPNATTITQPNNTGSNFSPSSSVMNSTVAAYLGSNTVPSKNPPVSGGIVVNTPAITNAINAYKNLTSGGAPAKRNARGALLSALEQANKGVNIIDLRAKMQELLRP